MNYNDQILENKTFKFVKQLIFNLALSVCIVLAVCLVFAYAFNYRAYNVLTGSMEPSIQIGDLVVVHKADEYKVGDVLKFDQTETSTLPTVHRIIAIKDGTYVCHGDNVQYIYSLENQSQEEESQIASTKDLATLRTEGSGIYQFVTIDQVEGKVVATLSNYGSYVTFISNHKVLFITIILGIWCFTYTISNEIEIKQAHRMEY